MDTRTFPRTLFRVLVLGFVMAVVYALDFAAFKWNASLESFAWLLVVGILQAAVLGYVLVRSTWHGWKLIAALFGVYLGITVLQTQIEAVVFLQYLEDIIPAAATSGMVINGLVASALVALFAVFLFNKFRPSAEPETPSQSLQQSALQWTWKVGALAVIYVVIYLAFGALVAKPLAGPAFDEYYANLQLPVWFVPFQILRGILWVLLTIPVIRMMRGSWREIGLGVALMLSVLIASLVIPPNEFMPAPIRMAHLVELFTSMFVFGWIDFWLLSWRRHPKTQQTDLRPASHAV